MDFWISFWFAELSEPPASPIYLALFIQFIIVGAAAIYAFRGIPHWIIESPQSRFLRLACASMAILAIAGASILVLQSMSVPVVSRRIWLGLVIGVLCLHLLAFVALRRFILRRPNSLSPHQSAELPLFQ
jgi:hypothetical protein